MISSEKVASAELVKIVPGYGDMAQAEVIFNAIISEAVDRCKSIKVTDDASYKAANEALLELRSFDKRLEEARKKHLQPLTEYSRHINNTFTSLRQPLVEADSYLTRQNQDYRNAVNAAAAKEQARLNRLEDRREARAEERGEVPVLPETVSQIVPTAEKTVETDSGKMSYRTDYKAERIPGKEKLIPMPYFYTEKVLAVVDQLVNATVRSSKGTIPVPGYRILKVETPVSRPGI